MQVGDTFECHITYIRRLIETCFGGTEIETPFKMLLCGYKKN